MVTLQSIIEKLKQTPVSIHDLKKLVPSYCRVVKLEQIHSQHRSELFKNHTAVIVLLPSDHSDVGHFVALLGKEKGYIEYFSSLGESAEKEQKRLSTDKTLLHILGKRYQYNQRKLQQGKFSIQSCGMWVLTRVILQDLKLREFQQLFSRKVTINSSDDLVSIMVLLLYSQV